MHILVTVRQLDASDKLKSFAEERANKLTRYYDLIQEIEVTIEGGKEGHEGNHVEVLVNAEHNNTFVANASDDNPYAAIDACCDKLERQISEHKKKFRNRKHQTS
ncbi:MAG: ribosome-associated translation inhibitor RaiA [Planctomycetota bacterium]